MFSRRHFLMMPPAVWAATVMARSSLLAQSQPPAIPVRTMNHVRLRVADVQRSVDFYQKVFGMPVVRKDTDAGKLTRALVRIGPGPHHLVFESGTPPAIVGFCFGVEAFDPNRLTKMLAAHGVEARVSMRNGTPELSFTDMDMTPVGMQDVSYCGGSGALGNVCPNVVAVPGVPPIAASTLHHVTKGAFNADKTLMFYETTFGMPLQVSQPFITRQPSRGLAIGKGPEAVFISGGAPAAGGAPTIGHFCMGVKGFVLGEVMGKLADLGITYETHARNATPPYNVSEGVQLKDPDNLSVQLVDTTYCGGRGYLGNICP